MDPTNEEVKEQGSLVLCDVLLHLSPKYLKSVQIEFKSGLLGG